MFEIGDTVVHPQHGVGQIIKLENREFERGDTRRYYEISMTGDSTVWVPVDLPDSSLRPLARKSELDRCREILQAKPRPLTEDGRIRQSELAARLRRRTITVHCEIVRDLSAFVAHKPAYGTISGFLEALLRVLCQEWAMVQGDKTSQAVGYDH
jgi:RNA polymerase-interacting CarD/CdnL/TRCF family regulator